MPNNVNTQQIHTLQKSNLKRTTSSRNPVPGQATKNQKPQPPPFGGIVPKHIIKISVFQDKQQKIQVKQIIEISVFSQSQTMCIQVVTQVFAKLRAKLCKITTTQIFNA